jgi:hypothetical protein
MLLERIWGRRNVVGKEMTRDCQGGMEQENRHKEAKLLLALISTGRKVFL